MPISILPEPAAVAIGLSESNQRQLVAWTNTDALAVKIVNQDTEIEFSGNVVVEVMATANSNPLILVRQDRQMDLILYNPEFDAFGHEKGLITLPADFKSFARIYRTYFAKLCDHRSTNDENKQFVTKSCGLWRRWQTQIT